MVSNYEISCNYAYTKLKDVIYLISASAAKNIHIDGDTAYIDDLAELPVRLNGFNLSFTEETSLDERYRFTKTLTLSMRGYVNHSIMGDKCYAIIESEDGVRWLINVDFPAKITHTYNLNRTANQTDFTLSTISNFPTLKLDSSFEAEEPVCLAMKVDGIDTLQLLEFEKAKLDVSGKKVITTEDFKNIQFLGKSCTYQEVYDGSKVTNTISFNIPLGDYKSDWQYKMLEFVTNKYVAVITPIGHDNKFYVGFNYGLQPEYHIQTASNSAEADIITITLTEVSNYGCTAAIDWTDDQSTETVWNYVKYVGQIVCFECTEQLGVARYLVKQEVNAFGFPTGNYMVLSGYEEQFPELNIVGTFDDSEEFPDNSCGQSTECHLYSNIPLTITFTSITSYTYNVSGTCNWEITNVPAGITVSQMSGAANTAYTLTVNNTLPVMGQASKYFNIRCGNEITRVNILITPPTTCIRPTSTNINCLAQNVRFAYNSECALTVIDDAGLIPRMASNVITFSVPVNTTSSAITYTITVSGCNCSSDIITLTINQDKQYSQWLVEPGAYDCASGNSYTIERLYTGTTSGDISTRTEITRRGSMITSADTRCMETHWEYRGNYMCVDGNKYKALEEVRCIGETCTPTGAIQPGELVESASTFCNTTQYKWEITDQIICE